MSDLAETSFTTSVGQSGQRVLALDALRGLSVTGIVWMNVIAFSMPAAAYVNPRSYGGEGPFETALWAAVFLLVEDKFRALFAMLFGTGVAILMGRHSSGGLRGHYARMAVLFVIGITHATLLASNDILRVYAVAGLVLPFVLNWRARTLFWAAGVIMAGQLLVSVWYYWDYLYYWLSNGFAVSVQDPFYQHMEYLFGADPRMMQGALAQGQEGFAERILRRFANEPYYTMRVMAGLPSSIAAMLIGIGLWKNGLLKGEWDAARLRALASRLILLSLPVLLVMLAMDLWSGFDPFITMSIALIWSAPFDIVLAVGWAALTMLLFTRASAFVHRLAAAGRMALTNYLLTSVIFAGIFSTWGLGLFGEVSRLQAYALCLLPIAAMLLLSTLWLRRFRQGPAEWLWRRAARTRQSTQS